jgi:acetylglutamate kinase
MIPVIAPLAADVAGNVLNVNADTVASALAQSIGAEKLIIMTNVPGILRKVGDFSSLVSYLDIDSVQMMIENGEIKGGMVPKAQACIEALRRGVPRTHLIDGGRRDSLLQELFLNEGVGTMIVAKHD